MALSMSDKLKVLIIFGDTSDTVDTMSPYFWPDRGWIRTRYGRAREAGIPCFFSGGRAPKYIREDEDLLRIRRYFLLKNAPIASVCHGGEIPAWADRVSGWRMATVPKCKFDLEVCGGTFVDEACVIDGNLVSGRTFRDHGHYMGPWMKLIDELSIIHEV